MLPGHTQYWHGAQAQLQSGFLALLDWVCLAQMQMCAPALTWPLTGTRARPDFLTSSTPESCTVINLHPCKLFFIPTSNWAVAAAKTQRWSPSRHMLMFLGVPLSVLPQQTTVCPHQSPDLSVVSHSSRVGISRCYLPVQVLASSPDLPFLLAWLRSQQTYWKLFPRTESHPLITVPGLPWPPLLPRETKTSEGQGWGDRLAWRHCKAEGWVTRSPLQTHSTTQSVKAAWEVGVKGEKWLLRQHSCLLPSFQSSQLGFGVETSAQTHPSPRHGQWVKGRRSGVIQWLTLGKCTQPRAALRSTAAPGCTGTALCPQPPDPQNWRHTLQRPWQQAASVTRRRPCFKWSYLHQFLPQWSMGCLYRSVPACTILTPLFTCSE